MWGGEILARQYFLEVVFWPDDILDWKPGFTHYTCMLAYKSNTFIY